MSNYHLGFKNLFRLKVKNFDENHIFEMLANFFLKNGDFTDGFGKIPKNTKSILYTSKLLSNFHDHIVGPCKLGDLKRSE